ncbi:MAG: cadmium-translocating P-type ATPase [Clostridia bacterium]|nr:cadmium-translocating P-type ATPase [Clostridia bacterium]
MEKTGLEHEHPHSQEQEHEHRHEHEHEHEHHHGHDHGHEHGEEEGSVAFRVGKLIVGAVVFLVGLLLPRFIDLPFAVRLGIFIAAYLILGYDVLWSAVRNLFHGELFDECFLMTVSTVGAFAIGEYPEAVAVMLFYQVGELFQDIAVDRSRDSITALMDIRPDSAVVLRGGEWVTVSPEEVEVGETIRVKPGERVPLDGVVTDGISSVDTRALTGESVPQTWRAGDAALSGCVAENGVLTIRVTKEAGESTAAKILELMQSAAEKKAPAENFITKFARVYTPVVCLIAVLLAVVPPLFFEGSWAEWIRRGCVTLAISCPCALVISIPLTFFGGIGAASKKGVLVKGSAYLEALADADTVVFDKTGTLTKGEFAVTGILPAGSVSEDELLTLAAHAEAVSNHPIARSILDAYGRAVSDGEITDAREIAGHGVSCVWNGRAILAGNAALLEENGIGFPHRSEDGTVIHTAADGIYCGAIVIEDGIKEDAAEALRELEALGVKRIAMLTGDRREAAESVAGALGVKDVKSGLLPANKVACLEEYMADGKRTVFVGDGINDAPVLARADVGAAMGALGSDAAIGAADIVLMKDRPSALCDAIRVSKRTKRIVTENIAFAIGVKIVFILLGAFGLIGMWAAVFGDVGVMLLAVLNAMRILRT